MLGAAWLENYFLPDVIIAVICNVDKKHLPILLLSYDKLRYAVLQYYNSMIPRKL